MSPDETDGNQNPPMIRFFKYLVIAPIAILFLIFAFANRQWVVVSFDPFTSGDMLLAFQPGDRLALAAEGVDQLQRHALAPGEDAAIVDARQFFVRHGPPLAHEVLEPREGIRDQRRHRIARRV